MGKGPDTCLDAPSSRAQSSSPVWDLLKNHSKIKKILKKPAAFFLVAFF
ncbi:hypothetical protein PhaeoP75_00811 [Phaeobacter gallaeciensis]|nr:hypothetical protein Gal_00814 [Phaeobacter gallaeciensis DSM 26640]ATE91862.1 hypothetical protein PhaeoP11_00810 [Phaeobacter gallaeciensis]ATE98314.1 hypothetical protein PhaeoP73_03034 [Phaeobacter gallaeciensis]ATF00478.1 hypothetical protein PhaeoP75_00811 [Phaeobacter gallaeciensis]